MRIAYNAANFSMFSAGTRLGCYEIVELLGKGGMGEVYRARDPKLRRDVAIKTLPEEFLRDHDRSARFQREAEVLASLNHPNIASLYDLQDARGSRFLVMELVEGETLAERITRGPLTIEEALEIGRQICEALEAAHEKGIIHRDLKPGNIKILDSGKAKVLDFGLAKASEPETSNADLSHSPTLSVAMTQQGLILGTAAYMSPEQAKGLKTDSRSDIFSFGCVLYEMLTGKQAFQGETVSDILASVLAREPDLNLLPPNLNNRIREVLTRCFEKSPKRRWHAAADVRIELENARAKPIAETLPGLFAPGKASRREWTAWSSLLAMTLLAVIFFLYPAHVEQPPEFRLDLNTAPTLEPLSLAISPDGRRIVFSALKDGKSQLWMRALDSAVAQPLAGTDGGISPFWSSDGTSLGFYANNKLKRIEVVGGAAETLANATCTCGGAWNRDGVILFPLESFSPIGRIPATGGQPSAVTKLEAGQTAHRFPQFLPDGQHFIYLALGGPKQGLYIGSLDGALSKRLTNADAAAVISPAGFLFFPRQTTLFGQAFDFNKQELSGKAFVVAEGIYSQPGLFSNGISATSNVLAYRTGVFAAPKQILTWLDRSGKTVSSIPGATTAVLSDVELSPDGKRVASWGAAPGSLTTSIWLTDTARGVRIRFTLNAANEGRPVWSSDGSRVAFGSNRSGHFEIYAKLSNGAGAEETLLMSDQGMQPSDWSSDGRFLMYRNNDPQTAYDLWVLPLSGDKKPFPVVRAAMDQRDGQFSPDGKFIVYESNESGRFEIYAQPFPGPGGRFQISTDGGAQPRWNKRGDEIFYVSLDSKMMSVPVKLSADGQSLDVGTPVTLFPVRIFGGPIQGVAKQQYAVSSDGQKFLFNLVADDQVASPIRVILNWHPDHESN